MSMFSKGAGVGMVVSFGAMMTLGVGSQIAKSRGLGHNQLKPLSTEGCPYLNSTLSSFKK